MTDHYEEYLKAKVMLGNLEKCPHLIIKWAGDESYSYCELTKRPLGRIKPCLKEYGDECEIYNEILQERENE